jgi:hypothetical protein
MNKRLLFGLMYRHDVSADLSAEYHIFVSLKAKTTKNIQKMPKILRGPF